MAASSTPQRVSVVTGAASGIGEAVARLFTQRGDWVVALDRAAPVDAAVAAEWHRVDLADAAAVATVVEAIGAEHPGGVDALVNAAGLHLTTPIERTSAEDFDRLMAVNARAPFLLVKGLKEALVRRRGAVVNVGSVHAVCTSTNIAAYAATKGAISAMTRALAIELGPEGVRVNAVLPGAVDTPMLRRAFEATRPADASLDKMIADFGTKAVLGRVAAAAEVAAAVRFLADGGQSSFVTGAELVVDGGAIIRLSTE